MHYLAHFVFLATLTVLCLAENFHFIKPDPEKKLNLSAPISIGWVVPPTSPEATAYNEIDIWWRGNGPSYELVVNLSLAVGVGEYLWDPKPITDALASTNRALSPGKEYFFEAKMHSTNSSAGASVQSEKYAVEGYGNISGGHLLQPTWGWIVAAILLSSGVFAS